MKLLLLCYSIGAGKGSEPGVGWNVASELSKRGHHVTVLSTGEFSEENHEALKKRPHPFRIIEKSCGLTQFHLPKTYRKWQKRIIPEIQALVAQEHFDLIHHVTLNQYRHISFINKIALPYLVGPVGGGETIPFRLIGDLPWKQKIKELLRYCNIDALPIRRRATSSKSKGIFLASNPKTLKRLQSWGSMDVRLSTMIAIKEQEVVQDKPQRNTNTPFFLFAGRMIPEKGLDLVLQALTRLWADGKKTPLFIAGAGSDEEQQSIINRREQLGLPEQALQIASFIPRDELLKKFPMATAFIYAAYRDSGSMAVLESLASGCLPICFNLTGQHWLPDNLGIKVSLLHDHPVQSLYEGMKQALSLKPSETYDRERYDFLMSKMTWSQRINEFEQLYQELVSTQ